MFANGSVATITDEKGHIYVSLAGVIVQLMGSANAMDSLPVGSMTPEELHTIPTIISTIDSITLTLVQLLQFEVEKREFDTPDELLSIMEQLDRYKQDQTGQ